MAFLHICDKVALALVKADQHRALFAHKTHRNAGAVAVAPGRAFDSAQHVVGLDLADMPEVVLHHPLLDRDLGADMQMLHFAAATGAFVQAEMRTGRTHALRRLLVDFA